MRLVVCILLSLALFGCKKGYDQSLMAKLTAPQQKIVGKYKMEMELNTGDPKESKDFANLMEIIGGGETYLECFPDKSFVMKAGDVDVKGTWDLEATFVTLRISDVGGVKPEQVVKTDFSKLPSNPFGMSQTERDEFLKSYSNGIALEKAEDMSYLRVGVDGSTLYRAGEQKDTLFGTIVTFFKKVPQE